MINGKPSFLFTAKRGLRLGDPMSPYLFLMVIEVLILMIYSATEKNWIHGFSPGTGGPQISHLQFADDTMVFLNATTQEVCILKLILRNCKLTSGLRINLSKSSLIPVGNCSDLSLFAGILGCKIGDLPFDYLGLPLGTPYKASGIWLKFMDRLENRLAGWKRNSLSKGGRLTLIRSCLMSLHIYFLSLFPIPSAVSLKMERLVRNFLWGESATKKALCLVKWDVCKKLTVFGGLSIRGFNMMNRSLLAKWIWRFTKEHNSLWRVVILSNHGAHKGNVFPKIPSSSHGTGLWKHISRESVFIHQNSSFELGNGNSIRFWHDKWCCPQTVRTIAPNIYRIAKRKQSLVSEIVKLINGQLIIEMDFYSPVEYAFMSEIVAIHNLVQSHPIDPLREDVLCWEGDDRDLGFSVSNAYMKLSEPGQEEFPVKEVWLKGIPLKVQFFIWTAFQDRIATIDLLIRRRKIWVNHCCLCLQALETSAHLLVHCKFTRKLWYDFLQLFHTSWVMSSSFVDLVLQWKCKQAGRMRNRLWKLLLPAIAWAVWGEHNSRSFEGKASSVTGTILAIKALIHSWCLIDPAFSSYSLKYFLFNFDQLLQ